MRLREHDDSDDLEPDDSTSTDHHSGALREEGDALLAAADEAINRALSQNSGEFLAQNRQMGGQ